MRGHIHGASHEHALKLGYTCSHASPANPVPCSLPYARSVSASPWRAAVQHQYMRERDSNMHGQLCPTQIHAPSCTTQRSIAATAVGQPAQLVVGALAPLLHSSAAWALVGLRSVLYSNAEAVDGHVGVTDQRSRGRDQSSSELQDKAATPSSRCFITAASSTKPKRCGKEHLRRRSLELSNGLLHNTSAHDARTTHEAHASAVKVVWNE